MENKHASVRLKGEHWKDLFKVNLFAQLNFYDSFIVVSTLCPMFTVSTTY